MVRVLVTDYRFADLDKVRIDQVLQDLAFVWIGPSIEDKGEASLQPLGISRFVIPLVLLCDLRNPCPLIIKLSELICIDWLHKPEQAGAQLMSLSHRRLLDSLR